MLSIIIPNHNGESTIGKCLEAAYGNMPPDVEVVVVDDCSSDNSVDVIKKFSCKLIRLEAHRGASAARNGGAQAAGGEVLFFIDSDCLLTEGTLKTALETYKQHPNALIGGTYTPLPYDRDFFSKFQSVFVNYFEGAMTPSPDYIATHAMLIRKGLFLESGGFREDFLPIIEDVDFSHRMRRGGMRLVMNPALQVRHIFGFSLWKSLKNAFRKSFYWTKYSIGNKDLFRDSGTASIGLKANVGLQFLTACLFALYLISQSAFLPAVSGVLFGLNLFISRGFVRALWKADGPLFAIKAMAYYTTLYAAAVGLGGVVGVLRCIRL